MSKFRLKDIPGFIIAGALLVFSTYAVMKLPNRKLAPGLDGDWQCAPGGRAGPDSCIKKSLLAPRALP
jgi:hypothetical protein